MRRQPMVLSALTENLRSTDLEDLEFYIEVDIKFRQARSVRL
jgi:hypothetical protein